MDYLARKKLRDLRQISLVQDYVKKFTIIMLDIQDMIKMDKIFYFMDSLSCDVLRVKWFFKSASIHCHKQVIK